MRVNDSMTAFHDIGEYLGFDAPKDLTSAAGKKPLFIALDVEFNPKNITQLGISIFDPCSLTDPLIEDSISMEHPISSTLYATEVSRFKERRRKPSHFGQRRVLDLNELRGILEDVLAPIDTEGRPRSVVLVGHMILSDILEIQRSCGLDVSKLPSVKAIMDTQRISRHILHPQFPLSLRDLLIALGLEYVGLHNPSHDSRYALRALLIMSCRSWGIAARAKVSSESTNKLLELVERIANFHQRRKPILWCDEGKIRVVRDGDQGDILDPKDGSDRGDNYYIIAEFMENA